MTKDHPYYNGKNKCLSYNDENIDCVMCYETVSYINKNCRKKPSRRKGKVFNGRIYCKSFDRKELECILCMEKAQFKIKNCYSKQEEKK